MREIQTFEAVTTLDQVFEIEVFDQQDAGGRRPQECPDPGPFGLPHVDRVVGARVDVPHRGWMAGRDQLGVGGAVIETVARVRAREAGEPGPQPNTGGLSDENQVGDPAKWRGARTADQGGDTPGALVTGMRVAGHDPGGRQRPRHPERDRCMRTHVLETVRARLRDGLERRNGSVLDAMPGAVPQTGRMDRTAAAGTGRLVLHVLDGVPWVQRRQ
jgi:hypothetical protein